MKQMVRYFFLACILCPVSCVLCPNAKAELSVGAAKQELRLPAKIPLAGYSRRHGKPSTGVHDPVSVRALVLRDQDTTVALVSVDLLIIDERLYAAVQQRLRQTHPALELLLAATHTHSGPGAYGQTFLEKISMGQYDQAVFDELVRRISAAVAEAVSRMEPVTALRMVVTTTQGLVANRMQEDGVVDPELIVVSLEGRAHRPLALVANFSAHPTTLGAGNRQLSADYPGVLVRELERRHPGAVSLFFVGAVGDQAPVKHGEQFERAEWLGSQLAQQAGEMDAKALSVSDTALQAAQQAMPLPPARVRLGKLTLPSWMGRALVDDDATLSLVRVGPVLLIGVPCDLSAELGLALKRYARERGYQPLIVGFADDYIGYCLPKRLYERTTYEASLMFNGSDTGELLVYELQRMIDQMQVMSDQ